jgi:hypothetical protein
MNLNTFKTQRQAFNFVFVLGLCFFFGVIQVQFMSSNRT